MEEVVFKVPSISCEGCAGSVRRALERADGVGSVEVDVQTKDVRVQVDPAKLTGEQVAGLLRRAGYPPEG